MAKKLTLHGYPQTFNSKSEAIRFLLKEGKHNKTRISQKLNCTPQHIYIEAKKLNLIEKNP